VLTSQCLDRRIPNKQILIDEIAAWEHDRNANQGFLNPDRYIRTLAVRISLLPHNVFQLSAGISSNGGR